MDNLFQFNRGGNQRRKKARGAMRKAVRAARNPHVFDFTPRAEDQLYYRHWHLDRWCGLSELSPKTRGIMFEGYARLFRHIARQAHLLGKPYQLWMVLLTDAARYDAVYLHTPNPRGEFPVDLRYVEWGLPELVALFQPLLPEFTLVAGRVDRALYLFAEGVGVSLKQENGAA